MGDSNFGFKCFGVDELDQQGLSGVPGLVVRALLACQDWSVAQANNFPGRSCASFIFHMTFDLTFDRSDGRDVYIYDAKEPPARRYSVAYFLPKDHKYPLIEIIPFFQSPFSLQNENGVMVERNERPLQPGKYYVNDMSYLLMLTR